MLISALTFLMFNVCSLETTDARAPAFSELAEILQISKSTVANYSKK